MSQGAPLGTLGLASKSGWMTTELFLDVMKHFVKCSNSSKENPSLLVYIPCYGRNREMSKKKSCPRNLVQALLNKKLHAIFIKLQFLR